MPLIRIDQIEGRSDQQITALGDALMRTLVEVDGLSRLTMQPARLRGCDHVTKSCPLSARGPGVPVEGCASPFEDQGCGGDPRWRRPVAAREEWTAEAQMGST